MADTRIVTSDSPTSENPPISIICISDLHHLPIPPLPPGDLLLITGDLSQSGTPPELNSRLEEIKSAKQRYGYRYVVVIAGNHDRSLDSRLDFEAGGGLEVKERQACRNAFKNAVGKGVFYLENELVTLQIRERQVSVYASPYSLSQKKISGFTYPPSLAPSLWSSLQIPSNLDILITHGTAMGYLDAGDERYRCSALTREIWRIRPKLFAHGHVHKGYGAVRLRFCEEQRGYEEGIGVWGEERRDLAGGLEWKGRVPLEEIERPLRRESGETIEVNSALKGGEVRKPIVVYI